jgi:hypothetical protein
VAGYRIAIRPTDVGKRVTVQYFTEEGLRSEALGHLEHVEIKDGEPVLHIRKRDDSLVAVPMGRIKAGRVVPNKRP